MSAGLSGAFAARGVGRGDVVMTLVGNRVEWVLSLLACWRMGAVALPCNTQLRRARPRAAHRGRQPDALRRRRGAARRAPGRDRVHDHGRGRRGARRGPPAGDPGRDRRPRPRGPGADRVHLRDHRRAARGAARPALPARPAAQAEHWLGARRDELVWCTTATGWSKSARNVFLAPWLCGAAAMIVDGRFDARRAAGADRARGRRTSSARRRPSTGCSPSAPSCGRCPRCAAWSRPASRSTPR